MSLRDFQGPNVARSSSGLPEGPREHVEGEDGKGRGGFFWGLQWWSPALWWSQRRSRLGPECPPLLPGQRCLSLPVPLTALRMCLTGSLMV